MIVCVGAVLDLSLLRLFQKGFYLFNNFINWHKLILFRLAQFQFYHSLFQTFFSHRHTDGTADQIRVIEFNARAFIAIIEQNRDARLLQR